MKFKLRNIIYSRPQLLLVLLFIVLISFSLSSEYFLTFDNILGSTQFGAVLALVSIGQSLVWLAGKEGIDLSVGTIVSFSGVLLGKLFQAGVPLSLCIVAALLLGLLCGMINGLLCAIIKVPALIVTLGMSFIYGSLALYLTGGQPISGFPDTFKWLSLETTLFIPNQVLFIVIPTIIIIYFVMYRTTLGRKLYLVGNNETAARFATIDAKKIRFAVYSISGLLAGIGSIIMCSWLMTSNANSGAGLDMQSITVTALGGIGVTGGQGNLAGVILGILVLIYMNSGLDFLGVNSIWKLAIQGAILIFAVALNQFAIQKKK